MNRREFAQGIATATLAAVSGTGGGLGDIIVNQASYRAEGVLAAALCVTALAFAVDFALQLGDATIARIRAKLSHQIFSFTIEASCVAARAVRSGAKLLAFSALMPPRAMM